MTETYIPFDRPTISEAAISEVVDSLRSGWITTGPKTKQFEADFAAYSGARHAIALSSATAALHVALVAKGIGPEDEVITTPLTFCSTAHVIEHTRARVVLADVDPRDYNIDPAAVERAITQETRAIIPVHLAGLPCQMTQLQALSEEHSLFLLEDAAHATGAAYHNHKIGTIGDATAFSFYATKNLTTAEGGMLTTEDGELAERVRLLSLHGMSRDAWKRFSDEGFKHYQVTFPGFKYNMLDLQAAIGIHQLARVEKNLVRRNELWQRYHTAFADLPVDLPATDEPQTVHARHLYTLMIDQGRCGMTRDEFALRLHKQNIGTGVHYVGVHLQPYYRARFGFSETQFPNATWISERTVSIPLSASLTDEDACFVIDAVHKAIMG
jgi:dTDP-4-amino-4,6-dideoxygalactose transaminase